MVRDAAAREPGALREGEVAVELPARFDASLYYIGRIHTPWKRREDCPKNPRESDAVCTVVLDPRWSQGLTGLESVSSRGRALLDGPGAPGPGSAGAASLPGAPRHLRAAFAGAAQSDRRLGREARWHRGQQAHRSSASIAWTVRRSSISSPISPRPTRCRTRPSAGMPGSGAEVGGRW